MRLGTVVQLEILF